MPSEIEKVRQRMITGVTTDDFKNLICKIIDDYYDIIREIKGIDEAMSFTLVMYNDLVKNISNEVKKVLNKSDDKIQNRLDKIGEQI